MQKMDFRFDSIEKELSRLCMCMCNRINIKTILCKFYETSLEALISLLTKSSMPAPSYFKPKYLSRFNIFQSLLFTTAYAGQYFYM